MKETKSASISITASSVTHRQINAGILIPTKYISAWISIKSVYMNLTFFLGKNHFYVICYNQHLYHYIFF